MEAFLRSHGDYRIEIIWIGRPRANRAPAFEATLYQSLGRPVALGYGDTVADAMVDLKKELLKPDA